MKIRTHIAFVGLLGLWLSAVPQRTATHPSAPLNLSLRTSLVRQNLPLTRALDEVGTFLQGGYAIFGIEIRSSDGREPLVNLNLETGRTLADVIEQVLKQTPGYAFEIVSPHLINVFPAGAKDDAHDALNTLVPKFDVAGGDPGQILSDPAAFVPELAQRLRPEQSGSPQPSGVVGTVLESSPAARVNIHLEHVTVRQVLNAVSEAMEQLPSQYPPVGWSCTFQPQADAPGGGRYTWNFSWSVPRDWKRDARASEN